VCASYDANPRVQGGLSSPQVLLRLRAALQVVAASGRTARCSAARRRL
jgi:hypothetical protein